MIVFGCPKCGKQFSVPDTAVGQHGWCKGCGAIIRVPESGNASPDDIVDVKIDPQVEALLHHMASQLKEYRARAKDSQAELRTLRNERSVVAAHEHVIDKARAVSKKLEAQLSALEEERQFSGAELRELRQAVQDIVASDLKTVRDAETGPERDRMEELEAKLTAEREEAAATREKLQLLERQYAGVTNESESRIAEIERLQERLVRSEENARELAERCGKLEEQVVSLRAERDDARRMLEEQRAAEEMPEVVTARLQEKESTLQRLSEELRIVSASKGEMEALSRQRLDDVEHLSAELSGVSQSAEAEILEIQSELSMERNRHALAERALMHAQDDLRALRRQVDALRAAEAERDALAREAVLLREALQKAEKTIHDTQSRVESSRDALRKAEKRIRALEGKNARVKQGRHASGSADVLPREVERANGEGGEIDSSSKEGPFPGPFIPPSEGAERVEGLALIPEVLDDDFDDREMLDTLMRFLEPEE